MRAGVCAKSRVAWSVGGAVRAWLMPHPFHHQPLRLPKTRLGPERGVAHSRSPSKVMATEVPRNHRPVRTHGAETIQRQMPFPARGDVGIEEATRRVWGCMDPRAPGGLFCTVQGCGEGLRLGFLVGLSCPDCLASLSLNRLTWERQCLRLPGPRGWLR